MRRSLALFAVVVGVVGLLCVSETLALVDIETVPVGNPGNPGEMAGPAVGGVGGVNRVCGAVDYEYRIGVYEVTAGQYCEFLNAVADADTYRLWHRAMEANPDKPPYIERQGTWGSFTYSVQPGKEDYPAFTYSWINAARFANWMHNGQPQGPQDANSTEDGVYDLTDSHQYYNPDGTYDMANDYLLDAVCLATRRKAGWRWAIASEDEWYKAAFHHNNGATGDYYDYPTSSDVAPDNDLVEPTDPGNHATFYDGDLTVPGAYTPVGSHENSPSPYGTFDQGGNLWEWTDTVLDSAQYTIRGGEGWFPATYMHAGTRIGSCPMGPSAGIGVRLVQVPEPTSLAVFALVGLVGLRRRR